MDIGFLLNLAMKIVVMLGMISAICDVTNVASKEKITRDQYFQLAKTRLIWQFVLLLEVIWK